MSPRWIAQIEHGIIYDAERRELCPACLERDPCGCGATGELRHGLYALRETLLRQVQQLDEIRERTAHRASAASWLGHLTALAVCAALALAVIVGLVSLIWLAWGLAQW